MSFQAQHKKLKSVEALILYGGIIGTWYFKEKDVYLVFIGF